VEIMPGYGNDGEVSLFGNHSVLSTGMPLPKLLILIAVFLLTSIVSVVTGSTSLITVPVMIQLGIEALAVATNMFALIFLSVEEWLHFGKAGLS